MAEFQWWLLLVGLVAGGGLVAVVFLDGARREQDVEEAELPAEARGIAARLGGGPAGRRRWGRPGGGPRPGGRPRGPGGVTPASTPAWTRARSRRSSAST